MSAALTILYDELNSASSGHANHFQLDRDDDWWQWDDDPWAAYQSWEEDDWYEPEEEIEETVPSSEGATARGRSRGYDSRSFLGSTTTNLSDDEERQGLRVHTVGSSGKGSGCFICGNHGHLARDWPRSVEHQPDERQGQG